ncbi:MAG: recombination protein RmuC [Actinomycetota bacterium]|jgi:DNA recombination protein RmuC|nr:recombination protein RmuC [Actinomycetota bacterium]
MTVFLALLVGLAAGVVVGRMLVRRDEAALAASFEGIAARALRGEAERDLAHQQQSVRQLVEPLREQLGRVEGQLRGLETERARAFGELSKQVDTVRQSSELLGRETAALVNALRKPQARGQWGEMQLRRVVEHAGMLERCDFDEQATVRDADGRALRPDLVVRLAGQRSVVVDAKVTLAAYLEAAESTDEDFREQRLVAHARHLRQHVDRLADKAYWQQFPDAPEFVVLFVPGEAFLAPALERDPALLEHAYARRVHIATPTTLVSLLRAVAYAWQQHALTENAQEVFRAGKELYNRLSTLGGHVDKLGRSLNTAVNDYNKTVASMERNLLPAARRMADLGLAQDGVDAPRPVDGVASRLVSPELTLVALPDERLSS